MDCDLLSVNRWSQRGSMEGGALGAGTRALCTSGRSSHQHGRRVVRAREHSVHMSGLAAHR